MNGVFPLPTVTWPPNANTSFGAARSGDRPPECGGGHCGVDLYLAENTPVFSVADGTVYASSSGTDGQFIWIDHAGGWRSHYVHLNQRNVSAKQRVSRGQQIGLLGKTGIYNDKGGAHLHFGLSYNGKYVDPLPELQRWLAGAGGAGLAGLLALGVGVYFLWKWIG